LYKKAHTKLEMTHFA